MVEPVRFLHTADWQLGMTRHFLDADAQPRYTAARIDAIGALAAVAREQECAFAVVCGDVFEGRAVGPRVIRRAAERLAEFDVPVYLLPGNHDPQDAGSIYGNALFRSVLPDRVVVLPGGVTPVAPRVEILAAPWTSKHPTADLVAQAVAAAPAPAPGVTRIIAGHGRVDLLSPDPTDPAMIRIGPLEREIAAGRVQFVALGDRHSRTDVGVSGRIWYAGTPVATDYDELAPNEALVVSVQPDGGVEVQPHRVGTWQFLDLVRGLTGAAAVRSVLQELSSRTDKDTTVVRLSVTGALGLAEKAEWDDGLAQLRQVYAAIEVWGKKSDLTVRVDPDDWADLAVQGYAGRALQELAGVGAGSGPTADVARDALALAHRLVRSAR